MFEYIIGLLVLVALLYYFFMYKKAKGVYYISSGDVPAGFTDMGDILLRCPGNNIPSGFTATPDEGPGVIAPESYPWISAKLVYGASNLSKKGLYKFEPTPPGLPGTIVMPNVGLLVKKEMSTPFIDGPTYRESLKIVLGTLMPASKSGGYTLASGEGILVAMKKSGLKFQTSEGDLNADWAFVPFMLQKD